MLLKATKQEKLSVVVGLTDIISSAFGLHTCTDDGMRRTPIFFKWFSILTSCLLDKPQIGARMTSIFLESTQ